MQNICHKCIGEKELKKWIRKKSQRRACSFCLLGARSIPLLLLSQKIASVFRREYKKDDYSDYFVFGDYLAEGIVPEGTQLEQLLGDLVETYEPRILSGIIKNLPSPTPHDIAQGDEIFFDDDNYYVRTSRHYISSAWLKKEEWRKFSAMAKHQSRSFNENHRKYFDKLFSDLDKLSSQRNFSIIKEIPKGTKIFRGRLATNEEDARCFYNNPLVELDARRKEKVKANRMNGPGIRTFYGALDVNTCVAELRPGIGDFVVIGKFELMCPLKILDLSYFKAPHPQLSIFKEDYEERHIKFNILSELQKEIARPISTGEEVLEYIPTQILAEYIKEILGCSAIQYASSRLRTTKASNIAILKDTKVFIASQEEKTPLKNCEQAILLKLLQAEISIERISKIKYTHEEHNFSEEF